MPVIIWFKTSGSMYKVERLHQWMVAYEHTVEWNSGIKNTEPEIKTEGICPDSDHI